MKKENIIIVEALSASINYFHDIMELGYNPISLEMYEEEDKIEESRKIRDKMYSLNGEEHPQILRCDKDYEKTLEMVKEFDPLAIIPGSDAGIDWATRLAHDLGLPGNDPRNLKKMIDKKCSQDALKQAGIRHIKSQFISSFDEAKDFVSQLNNPHVVIKPAIGQSTVGVCICKNDDEMKDAIALNEEISFGIVPGEEERLLIQEYIGGEEYIINTVCCKGYNRVISAYHYEKILIEGRGAIYDYDEPIDESDLKFRELAEYNEKVISALGLEYGVVHGEYKIDENGPVLIEMNCRIPGPYIKYYVMDKVWGYHSTELSLESYINPDECIKKANEPLKLKTYYVVKIIIIYDDIDVADQTFEEAFGDLESLEYSEPVYDGEHFYPKTVDLVTSGGFVFLTNADKTKLFEDVDTIRRMEKFEVEKIFEIK